MGLGSQGADKKSSASIACFLAANGADLGIKNKKGQVQIGFDCLEPYHPIPRSEPLGPLSRSKPMQGAAEVWQRANRPQSSNAGGKNSYAFTIFIYLSQFSPFYLQGIIRGDGMVGGPEDKLLDECLVCSDQRRNVLFAPCGHITVCSGCSPRVKKCLLCKEYVDDR